MSDIAIGIITTLLGGGLIMALVAAYKSVAERRKINAEADSIGAKTEVELESIQITSMVNALQAARSINDDYKATNTQLRSDLADLTSRFEASEVARRSDSAATHQEMNSIRVALRASQEWNRRWIEWGNRVAPNEPKPEAPPGYTSI